MLTNILIVVAFALAVFFPLAYRRSKWTKYLPGRALMLFSVIVAGVLGLGVWRVLTGGFAPEWVRQGSYLAVIVGLLVMDIVLLREQATDRRHVLEHPDEEEVRR